MHYVIILGIKFHCISQYKTYFFASLFLLYYWTNNDCNFHFNHKTNIIPKAKSCVDRNSYRLYSFSRKMLNDVSSSNLRYNFNDRIMPVQKVEFQYYFEKYLTLAE